MTPRYVDRALFLAGKTTLTLGEVAHWAREMGYPMKIHEKDASKLMKVRAATDETLEQAS